MSLRDVLEDAIDFALSLPARTDTLDALSFLLVLFRRVKTALDHAEPGEGEALVDLVHRRVGRALRPGGSLTNLIMRSLNSANKAAQLRSSDLITAACKMATSLLPPISSGSGQTSLLAPLFNHVVQGDISRRPNLVAINGMIEHMPVVAIPQGLLERLLRGFESTNSPSVRCSIIVSLLSQRRIVAETSIQGDVDRYMLCPLLPFFNSAASDATITHLTRYLLPALFKRHPSSAKGLLVMINRITEQAPRRGRHRIVTKNLHDRAFTSWISVASLAISSGQVSIDDLPQNTLRDAMVHEQPEIRLRAFQLLAGTKDLLDPRILDLIKESLSWNSILTSAG